jgi:branched-chain amino acid transport system substrate-binding protein
VPGRNAEFTLGNSNPVSRYPGESNPREEVMHEVKMGARFLAIVAMTALAGAGAWPPAALAADAIKIGVLLPLSGRYASAGQANKRGIDLVINEINKEGGIKALGGAKLELTVADDASDQVTTAQEARRLINQDKVGFILGPYATPEAEAAAPVAERGTTGILSTQASFDGLFQRNYKYFSSVSMTSSQFGTAYAEFLEWLNKEHAAKIKTVALTFPNNDYGKTASQSAADELKKANVRIMEAFGFPPNVSDMTPIVQRVKALAPDAIISIGYLQDGLLLHHARVAQGYASKPIWIGGSDAFSNDRLWTLLGDDIAKEALSGRTFALAQFDNGVKTPGVEWLVSAATAAGFKHEQIDQGMAAGAQVAWILVQALEDSKSIEPVKLAAAVRQVKLPADSPRVSMPQFANGLAFEATGQPKNPVALFEHWDAGKKSVVYPVSIATGPFPW